MLSQKIKPSMTIDSINEIAIGAFGPDVYMSYYWLLNMNKIV